jgi:hypothetical protein
VKAYEGKAKQIKHLVKGAGTKVGDGHPIFRIREIEVEQGVNLGS